MMSFSQSIHVFVFGDTNVRHNDWVTYSDRPAELCYNFGISNDPIRQLTFLLRSLTVTLSVLLFWFFSFF